MLPTFKYSTCSILVLILPWHRFLGRGRGWTVPSFPTISVQSRKFDKAVAVFSIDTVLPIWYPSLSQRRTYECDASSNDADVVPERCASESTDSAFVPRVQLRNATIDDMTLLLKWDEKEHLQGSWMGDPDFNDWNWEYELLRNDLSWRYQLIAEAVEEEEDESSRIVPIGFVQIIDPFEEETHYWGIDCERNVRAIDIWIGDERYINRGYGTQIMKQILQSSFVFGNTNVTAVIIDPMADNYAAHRFYQRLGFVPIVIRYFGPDRCLIHRMNRTDYIDSTNLDRTLDS